MEDRMSVDEALIIVGSCVALATSRCEWKETNVRRDSAIERLKELKNDYKTMTSACVDEGNARYKLEKLAERWTEIGTMIQEITKESRP